MAENTFFTKLNEKLASVNSVLLVLPPNADFDAVAAGLALFLSLKAAGKQAEIASPQGPTVNFSRLVGVDQIKTELEGKNLIVSLDYQKEAIAKVSYQIDENHPQGKKFNLIIQPEEGSRPLSSKNVHFDFGGAQFDLVLTFGVEDLAALGDLHSKNQALFNQKDKIFHFYREKQANFSQRTVELIGQLKLPFDSDMATNLALGIEKASQNFNPDFSSVLTFEAFAHCLRAGARRDVSPTATSQPAVPVQTQDQPSPVNQETPPIEQVESKEAGPVQTPPDWLGPKIYKSNTRL